MSLSGITSVSGANSVVRTPEGEREGSLAAWAWGSNPLEVRSGRRASLLDRANVVRDWQRLCGW